MAIDHSCLRDFEKTIFVIELNFQNRKPRGGEIEREGGGKS